MTTIIKNKTKKSIFSSISLICCLFLVGCTTVSRTIQEAGNGADGYPAARSTNPALDKPATVDLSRYKSVQTRPNQRSDIAIAFAASGGGYRAANLTLGVLMGLEQIQSHALKGNMLQEVDYFSSVSGSGFGIGYYLAQLHNHLHRYGTGAFAPPFSLQDNVKAMLNGSGENPLRADLAAHLFFGQERGLGLEKKLNASLLSTPEGGLRLGDIFIPKESAQSVELPYWTTNTTIYQNAAIFPFSPDILSRYRVTGYFHNGLRYYFLPDNFNSPFYAAGMPVSVGLTASASVPFATPATTLITQGCDSQCYLQLFDGGLADNLGVYTALTFLLQDHSKIKVLFIVDAYKGNTQPYSQQQQPPETIPLLWRVMTVGTDSNREHIRPNIRFLSRDLMCGNGAQNVIVIYLDLSHYPQAQQIGTKLAMSAESQKLLIKIGQELVRNDATIKAFISQLEKGKLTLGHC